MGILKNTLKVFIIVTVAYYILARFMVFGFVGDSLDFLVAAFIGGFSALLYLLLAGLWAIIRRVIT